MRWLLKVLQYIYCVYAVTLFVLLMLFVYIVAAIATLFGNIKGGNIIYKACTVWADIWFPLVFIFHKNIYEQKPDKNKSYIYVANHISYLDSALLVKTIRKPVRPLGKVEMAKVPVFGFIYRNVIVTVNRSSAHQRAKSITALKHVLQQGISVLFFPEGTFNTTHEPLKKFYDGAFRIAIETGTPIKPFLFLNSYDRLHYRSLFTMNPGKSRAIFLEEIDTTGYTLNDVAALRNRVYTLMHDKLIAYKASWIKETAQTKDVC